MFTISKRDKLRLDILITSDFTEIAFKTTCFEALWCYDVVCKFLCTSRSSMWHSVMMRWILPSMEDHHGVTSSSWPFTQGLKCQEVSQAIGNPEVKDGLLLQMVNNRWFGGSTDPVHGTYSFMDLVVWFHSVKDHIWSVCPLLLGGKHLKINAQNVHGRLNSILCSWMLTFPEMKNLPGESSPYGGISRLGTFAHRLKLKVKPTQLA